VSFANYGDPNKNLGGKHHPHLFTNDHLLLTNVNAPS
jgi:hypothetical protein